MNWELKTEMVKLGNQVNSEESRKQFQEFVLNNVDSFDGQAWDMFSMLTNIVLSEMKLDIEYWTEIYKRLKNVDCNTDGFGLASGFRIAMLQNVCEDELKLNS